MRIKIATHASDSVTLRSYDAATPPSKDDILIIGGKGYRVSARSLNLDLAEPEWIAFVRRVKE